MSSKILSGDAARSVPTLNWADRGMSCSPPTTQSPAASQVRTADFSGTEARLAQARQMGRNEGEQAMRAQLSSQIDALNLRMARAIEEMSAYKSTLRHDAEQDVVRLAVAIARKVLHREIATDPEALLGLVKVALEKVDARELHRVRVHPDQLTAIRKALDSVGAPRQIEATGDPSLERGAAVFETTRGSLDVSIETQLREIERGFADMVVRR